MNEETKGMIVSRIVPGTFLLGTRLGDWYRKNPYHKFNKGDILILRNTITYGYGLRPVAVVNGYEMRERKVGIGKEGIYDVNMYTDQKGDYFQWERNREVPEGVERIVEHELHFKWNIENQFKKVHAETAGEALDLFMRYASWIAKHERAA